MKDSFLWMQKKSLKFNGIQVRIEFDHVTGDTTTPGNTMSIQQHWILADDATVEIAKGNSATPLIVDHTSHEIKELSILLSFLDDETKTVIPEEKIIDALKKEHSQNLSNKKEFYLTIDKFPKITVLVDNLTFVQNPPNHVPYDILGNITANSKIKIVSDSKSLILIPQFPQKLLLNPHEFLEEYGIGGLSDECITHLQQVILARSKAKDQLKLAGIQPPKGMMLSGPPGTGKTTLARQIGKVLGVPESNITMMNGPEFFNKWHGNSEKNVRELFEPAKKDYKKNGDSSALHLVIIDEIDALLSMRDEESSDIRASVVNQFIGEVDGLKQINNIFIIGLTNRVDKIDPAVIRPGRLYPIINIGIPDKKGRLSILRIHTKELIDKNQIHADVDLDKIASLTDKMTGAQLASIIQQTYMKWILRLATMPENKNADKLKLRMKDFEESIETILMAEKKNLKGPPDWWYG